MAIISELFIVKGLNGADYDRNDQIELVEIQFEEIADRDETRRLGRGRRQVVGDGEFDNSRFGTLAGRCETCSQRLDGQSERFVVEHVQFVLVLSPEVQLLAESDHRTLLFLPRRPPSAVLNY